MKFRFEPLAKTDLPLLFDWLNRPHITEWWDGPVSFSQVLEKYLPRLGGGTISSYLAYLNGVRSHRLHPVVRGGGAGRWLVAG
jgi:hypothetical protein